jgi:hypothetical protein
MKQSLIDIVRLILNEMDSDDVNSISDTVEAMQVASVIKGCYLEMVSNRNWPHLRKLTQVHHSGTPDLPTHLKLPENTTEMVFFKYDKTKKESGDKQYQEVYYKHPDDFLRMVSSVREDTQNVVQVVDPSGITLVIKSNRAPMYWTSFDDEYLVCDSYDREVDDALQKTKTQCLIYESPKWIHKDDAIPDLPSEAFAALIEESKSTAFLTLKQMANEKAEQKATRQQRWLSRKAWRAAGGVRYDNYGRCSKK